MAKPVAAASTPSHNDGRDRFRFAVTVRMRFVRRTRGKFQPAPNHDRARDIEDGFNSIGNERVSISKNTCGRFDECKRDVDHHADEREARASLQIAGGNVRCRMLRRSHR